MAAIRKLPDVATLRRLRTKGWTQKKIAVTYGVTESAVWKVLREAGYTEPLATYKDILPWEIADEHKTVAVMERFRTIHKMKRGVKLRPTEERRLKQWLEDLEESGLVVNYHPAAPANSASSKGGFFYIQKEDQDDWIIRRPTS